MTNNIQESINNAISTIVSKRIDALALDKTVIGVIDSVVSPKRHIYKVKCDGGFFNAKSQTENAIYLPGMAVYVQIPQNDMTKDKLIISRATTLRNEIRTDVAVSAINNFSIIGTNLLKNINPIKNTGLGIRSYHDPAEENENTISHRVCSLFGKNYYYELLDKDVFDLYKKDATALMIEADFRTSLGESQKKQGTGVYGLGLNLKFKNSNFSIGETQGEIFNHYADLVQGEISIIDKNGKYVSIGNQKVITYSSQLEQNLKNSSILVDTLRKDDGLLDEYKNYISSIITVFETSGETKDIDNSWLDIMNAYLLLLDDLKYIDLKKIYTDISPELSEKDKMQKYYEEWQNTKIASSEYNDVAFVLDSNNMTGNPYNYLEWSTQYAIFSVDMKTLVGINDILFYKNGFEVDEEKCTHDNTGNETPREDLFIKNVKVYALKPISAENGDYRLEINSPDGLVFDSLNDNQQLEVVAKVSKAYYQILTEQSNFYWFKKNKNVTSVSSNGYQQYGGIGWAYLSDLGNRQRIVLIDSENQAYENIYKCVSVTDDTVVLAQEFYVYNLAAQAKLKIKSDLGVNFSFDSGIPTLTCLINDKEFKDSVVTNELYHYYWAIVVNGQRIFLDGKLKSVQNNTVNINDIMGMLSFNNLMNNVEFYYHDQKLSTDATKEENKKFERATRLKYPISNIGLENSATFECYVEQKINNKYVDIGCASLTLSNATNAAFAGYYIIIENGDQVFQYDEYGNAPNAKKLKDPLQIKPLICHLFNPVGIEIPSGNYTLNWIVPIENSMLIPENNDRLIVNPANNIREIDNKSREFIFNIAEFYNEGYQNNQVTCKITFGNETVTRDTNLFFTKIGENGTNGTDVVARIIPQNVIWSYNNGWNYISNVNSFLDKEPLTLYRSELEEKDNGAINLMDRIAKRLTLNNGRYSTKSTNDAGQPVYPTLYLAYEDNPHLSAHLYLKNDEILADEIELAIDSTTKVKTRTRWNVTGSTKTISNDKGKYIDLTGNGARLRWTENIPDVRTRPFSNYILRAQLKYGENNYYAFYPLCIINYIGSLPRVSRISIDKQFLLKEIMYNADGRNPVYNHFQGVKINNLPRGARVTWYARGGDVDNSSLTPDIKLLEKPDDKKENAKTGIVTAANINTIYILPNDEYNGSSCNNRVEAVIKDSSDKVIATAIIPIYMHLNTFGLASLNAWDGNTVTIDEDGGYVMAPQIGAGEKDDNNRFTGILMGKTETNTGHNQDGKTTAEKQTGLFGYSHGLQSIFLDAQTGNATFGLPDGQWLDTNQNPPVPKASSTANYNEGRIELVPGGTSTIGGWRLGNKSLYYTAAGTSPYAYKGTIGAPYKDTPVNYAVGHVKDIDHNDQGILLSAVPAYISVKGRKLLAADVDNSPESNIKVNDSLELQLDPRQRSIFSIFVHRGSTRTLVSGIDNKGRFIANRLQNGATTGTGSGSSTTFAVSDVWAFGDTTSASYVGAQFEAGSTVDNTKTFVTLFSAKSSVASDSGALYITGGEHSGNDYTRPLSLHGKTIGLYAYDNDTTHKTSKSTDSKVTISSSSFVAGNYTKDSEDNTIPTGAIALYNNSTSGYGSHITVPNNFTLRTKNSTSSLGNISLITRDSNDTSTYSYLTLMRTGAANLQGWTSLNGYAHNGDLNLRAQTNGTNKSLLTLSTNVNLQSIDGQVNIYGKANQRVFAGLIGENENSYLNITSTGSHLRTTTAATMNNKLFSRLYLADGRNPDSTNSYLDAYSNLHIRANNDIYSTATGSAYHISLGSSVITSLNIDTGATWNGRTIPANSTDNPPHSFYVSNSMFGGFKYAPYVKPGYKSSHITDLGTNYHRDSAALCGVDLGTGRRIGGISFNWGYFPGRMFANATDVTDSYSHLVNTGIYSLYYITSNTGFKTTQNSASIKMLNHTITGSTTSNGYTSSYSITGDNLYTLLQQLLGKVADALNYAKAAYTYAGEAYDRGTWAYNNRNDGLGTAAWSSSGDFASSWHTHSLPSNHMKAGAGGPYVTVDGTSYYLTNWQYTYNESTGGPQ